MYEISHREISKFNPRDKPITKETVNQKKHGLKPFEKFWYEVLKAGSFELRKHYEGPNGSTLDEDNITEFRDGAFIITSDLTTLYLRFDKNAEKYGPVSTDMIGKSISALCPSAKAIPKRAGRNGKSKRCRLLPSLATARAEFAKFLYVDNLDWETDDLEEIEEIEEEDMWT